MNDSSNIIGVFDSEEVLIDAIRSIKKSNVKIKNVFSPYPIHDVFTELNLKTRFPYIAFLFGAFGTISVFIFIYWASVINFPIMVGGKPAFTLSFVIILFEMTIFSGVALSLAAFFVRQKLYPGKVPVIINEDITDDKYVIVIETTEHSQQSKDEIRNLLISNGAIKTGMKSNVESI
jgi:hypothetical protein